MENQSNLNLEVLPNYMIERFDNQGVKIYNGISPIKEELGKGIGDCDLTSIKYYNEPKSIWEMFGFDGGDLQQVGNPNNDRYWKNIIPKDYSIFNREGLTNKLAVKMKASYNHADNQGPHYNLILNGVTISDGFLNTNQYQDFEFEILINSNLQFQQIRINFDNDGTDGDSQDRNVHVTSINIDGIDFDGNPSSHGDINVYYDAPQVYNYMEENPDQTYYNNNGVSSGGAMAWDGNMVFEIPTKYFTTTIDTYSEQDWTDGSYYPVLPKYGADGKFIDGNFPNNKIPFPIQSSITDENESDKNLIINIVNEKNNVEVFNDKSGNKNYGFSIGDFNPKFDEKTLRVKKNKSKSIFKTSKPNGAF